MTLKNRLAQLEAQHPPPPPNERHFNERDGWHYEVLEPKPTGNCHNDAIAWLTAYHVALHDLPGPDARRYTLAELRAMAAAGDIVHVTHYADVVATWEGRGPEVTPRERILP